MYHSQKMGVFISHIYGEYQKQVCQGIIDKAIEYGYVAQIYTTSDGENLGNYNLGEASILKVPNFSELDGVIFASGTYVSEELRESVRDRLAKNCSAPVIEICDFPLTYPTISLDNNAAFSELTEHFITQHHACRICYLGCAVETKYSDIRKKNVAAVIKQHQLSFNEQDTFDCTYEEASVQEALDFFLRSSKPDAIICYNDALALLLLPLLLKRGLRVPEDIAISGCDQLEDGQNISPSLTTVSFPVYELGVTAVDLLMQRLHKKEIPQLSTVFCRPLYGTSCGCSGEHHPNAVFYQKKLLDRIHKLETDLLESMRISACLQSITDIDDGIDILADSIAQLPFCSEFYLCLNPGWDSLSEHILELTQQDQLEAEPADEITLKLAIRHGKRLPQCSFTKKSILPEYLYQDNASSYIVTPLFFESKDYGYIVMAYEGNQIAYHFQLIQWIMNISQMLKTVTDSQKTIVLVNHLEEMYLKDPLTGLCNHQGFNYHKKLILDDAVAVKKDICCFLFDMDGLKTVNDHFGHKEGDFALQVIAHALESSVLPDTICARLSGDEFYVMSTVYDTDKADDVLAAVEKYLTNYNALSNKPYNISVSGGYAFYSPSEHEHPLIPDTSELFAAADHSMYEIKQNKQKNVLKK